MWTDLSSHFLFRPHSHDCVLILTSKDGKEEENLEFRSLSGSRSGLAGTLKNLEDLRAVWWSEVSVSSPPPPPRLPRRSAGVGVKALRSAGFVAWSLKGLWVLIPAKDPSITVALVRTAKQARSESAELVLVLETSGSDMEEGFRTSDLQATVRHSEPELGWPV